MESFIEGTKLRLTAQDGDVHEYVISSTKDDVFVLQSLLIESRRTKFSLEELKELFADNCIEFIQKTNDEEKNALKADLKLYSDEEIEATLKKREYIKRLIEKGVVTWSPKHLDPLITTIANEIDDKKPPSWRTVVRWHKAYAQAAYSLRGLYSNNYRKGNYVNRLSEEVERYLMKALEHYATAERVSVQDAYEKLEEYILLENKFRHRQDELPTPSYTTFLKRVHQQPPKEVMAGRHGQVKADIEYNDIATSVNTTRILERVALDHTRLDLFVLDTKLRLPLGRPWLTLAVDEHSKSITGIYISFQHPSSKVVMKLLMNSLRDKSYINAKYENIKNKWLCCGKALLYIFDNGKEFWSNDINVVLAELKSDHAFNPVKKPWFKAKAERKFGVINKRLLEKQKGKTFSSIKDRDDYDPKKNAVISFGTLIEIAYKWVINEFQVSPHGDEKTIPNIVWEESEKEYPPVMIEPDRLEIIMNSTKDSTLGRGGITYDYIRYDSEELAAYRSKVGNYIATYKINEDNLGYIYIFNKHTRKYFKVDAVNQAYAKGLRQCQHDAHKKHAKLMTDKNVDLKAIIAARIDIERRVSDDIQALLGSPNSISVSDLSALAKYAGVEQDGNTSVLDNMAHQQPCDPTPTADPAPLETKPSQSNDASLDEQDEDDDILDTTGWSSS